MTLPIISLTTAVSEHRFKFLYTNLADAPSIERKKKQ